MAKISGHRLPISGLSVQRVSVLGALFHTATGRPNVRRVFEVSGGGGDGAAACMQSYNCVFVYVCGRLLGYRYLDGALEKQDQYLKRMSGLIRLYSAILVAKKRRNQSAPHPHGIHNGWIWLSNFLNLGKSARALCGMDGVGFYAIYLLIRAQNRCPIFVQRYCKSFYYLPALKCGKFMGGNFTNY